MKSKKSLVEYLLKNHVNERGNIDISELDFGDFEGDINFSEIKTNGDIYQNYHKTKGGIYQNNHITSGEIDQEYHVAEKGVYQQGHASFLKISLKTEKHLDYSIYYQNEGELLAVICNTYTLEQWEGFSYDEIFAMDKQEAVYCYKNIFPFIWEEIGKEFKPTHPSWEGLVVNVKGEII